MRTLIWFLAFLAGDHDGLEPTDRLIPPGWKGNPWGPEATLARADGRIPPIVKTPEMKKWEAWGKQVIRDGDILFRRGDAKVLRGRFPFSKFIAKASGSLYSHTGIAAIENGEVVVYDTTKAGVRRQPLSVWVLDNVGPFGVKRMRPADAAYAPKAVAFCRETFRKQTPFDFDLKIDDNALYCVEMTEKAYRSNGLPLADPVKLGDMENADQYPIVIMAFTKLSHLTLDQEVFFPGNDRHGIWSSPHLVTVYDPSAKSATSKSAANAKPDTRQALSSGPVDKKSSKARRSE